MHGGAHNRSHRHRANRDNKAVVDDLGQRAAFRTGAVDHAIGGGAAGAGIARHHFGNAPANAGRDQVFRGDFFPKAQITEIDQRQIDARRRFPHELEPLANIGSAIVRANINDVAIRQPMCARKRGIGVSVEQRRGHGVKEANPKIIGLALGNHQTRGRRQIGVVLRQHRNAASPNRQTRVVHACARAARQNAGGHHPPHRGAAAPHQGRGCRADIRVDHRNQAAGVSRGDCHAKSGDAGIDDLCQRGFGLAWGWGIAHQRRKAGAKQIHRRIADRVHRNQQRGLIRARRQAVVNAG